jgi:hypothetical protein
MALQRVQMLLEPEQHRKLVEIARQQRKSIAEVTRQVINTGLEKLTENDSQARILATLEASRKLVDEMPMIVVDVTSDIHQMREERDDELTHHS